MQSWKKIRNWPIAEWQSWRSCRRSFREPFGPMSVSRSAVVRTGRARTNLRSILLLTQPFWTFHRQVALRSLPEEVVRETGEYRMLQAQFSLLYNESLQVKTQLDEARGLLLASKNSHLRHIEHMEVWSWRRAGNETRSLDLRHSSASKGSCGPAESPLGIDCSLARGETRGYIYFSFFFFFTCNYKCSVPVDYLGV